MSLVESVLGEAYQQLKLLSYRLGVVPVPYRPYLELKRQAQAGAAAARLMGLRQVDSANVFDEAFVRFALQRWSDGWSQYCQDKFVLFCLGEQMQGVFCEFGGADGLTHSNTALLESQHGWSGLLIEPNPFEFPLLRRNRPRCKVQHAAVKCSSADTVELVICGQLSSVAGFEGADAHGFARRQSKVRRRVKCVELEDAIVAAGFGGRELDYLSADSEGSELEILSRFSFEYIPRVITLETNARGADEAAIRRLLNSKGMREMLSRELTGPDLWFVREDTYSAVRARLDAIRL